MAALNDRMIKTLLKMIPQSSIEAVPQLIVDAVNSKLASVEHADDEKVGCMITPGVADCTIIIFTEKDNDFTPKEKYSGKEFVATLIKEVGQ